MGRQFIFDYSLLRKEIRKQFSTNAEFAREIGMGRVSLSEKLNNKRDWTSREMAQSMVVLGQDTASIPAYFFTQEVPKLEL